MEELLDGHRLPRRHRSCGRATYEVEIVDRLGAGDSFAAGLIHGLLDGDLQKGLDFGVAASAIKHTIPGDFAWITRDEVEAVLKAEDCGSDVDAGLYCNQRRVQADGRLGSHLAGSVKSKAIMRSDFAGCSRAGSDSDNRSARP